MAIEAEWEDTCFSKPVRGEKGQTQQAGTLSRGYVQLQSWAASLLWLQEERRCFLLVSKVWARQSRAGVTENLSSFLLLSHYLGSLPGILCMLQARKQGHPGAQVNGRGLGSWFPGLSTLWLLFPFVGISQQWFPRPPLTIRTSQRREVF